LKGEGSKLIGIHANLMRYCEVGRLSCPLYQRHSVAFKMGQKAFALGLSVNLLPPSVSLLPKTLALPQTDYSVSYKIPLAVL